MKLSIEALKDMEMTKAEQLNIMAKGGGVIGAPDTDGEEDCKPKRPLTPGDINREKLLGSLQDCLDIDLPPLPIGANKL